MVQEYHNSGKSRENGGKRYETDGHSQETLFGEQWTFGDSLDFHVEIDFFLLKCIRTLGAFEQQRLVIFQSIREIKVNFIMRHVTLSPIAPCQVGETGKMRSQG